VVVVVLNGLLAASVVSSTALAEDRNATSRELTMAAWEALDQRNYQAVEQLTKKCIELYGDEARHQQAELKNFPVKAESDTYQALDDVGTCYFILGEAMMQQERYQEAKVVFERILDEFLFDQCWADRVDCDYHLGNQAAHIGRLAKKTKGRLNKIRVLLKSN